MGRRRSATTSNEYGSAEVSSATSRKTARSRGSATTARVASAAVTRFGDQVIEGWYAAFGEQIFDTWHWTTTAELHDAVRHALAATGLPADLEDAMDSNEHDEALRRSHDAGLALVGGDVGTPITISDPDSEAAKAFAEIARRVDEELAPTRRRNPSLKIG